MFSVVHTTAIVENVIVVKPQHCFFFPQALITRRARFTQFVVRLKHPKGKIIIAKGFLQRVQVVIVTTITGNRFILKMLGVR